MPAAISAAVLVPYRAFGRRHFLAERAATATQLRAVWIAEKVALSLVPTPVTAGMIANAIPVAIKPYSIAVAALSSRKNLLIRRIVILDYIKSLDRESYWELKPIEKFDLNGARPSGAKGRFTTLRQTLFVNPAGDMHVARTEYCFVCYYRLPGDTRHSRSASDFTADPRPHRQLILVHICRVVSAGGGERRTAEIRSSERMRLGMRPGFMTGT
jgi:hypothetical protein